MYALRLPFQGALLNCAYRLPKVPLRLPWAIYAPRLPLQGASLLSLSVYGYGGLKAQWMSIAQGKRSGTLGN